MILFISAVTLNMYAGDYVRVTVDGGPNGYNKVNESRTDNGGGDVDVSISCQDPGNESCPTVVSPESNGGLSANAQSICSAYALNQINNNNLTGSTQISITGEGVFYLTWSSYDNQGRTSTITMDQL